MFITYDLQYPDFGGNYRFEIVIHLQLLSTRGLLSNVTSLLWSLKIIKYFELTHIHYISFHASPFQGILKG